MRNCHQLPPAPSPCMYARGGSRHSLLWAREEAPRCFSCHRVIIPIGPLEHATKARGNALHLAHAELPVGADRDASGMRSTRGEPGGDDRFHPVARFETPDLLLAHEIATREATLVNVGATIPSSPHRRDEPPS